MCDYSLSYVKSRAAVIGEKLVTRNFGTGTGGFGPADSDENVAICLLPGSELAFDEPVKTATYTQSKTFDSLTAIFRQVNKEQPLVHHDTLEFPDGQRVLLTQLAIGQRATVLQLPAAPKTPEEVAEQKRVEVVA